MLDELQDKVGEKIATLTIAEAAMVTSGAFSALMLGLAGILTGMDTGKVKQIPQLAGTEIKSEVIIQKNHQIDYNHAFSNCTVKLIYVETPDDVDKAVNEKTDSMHFLSSASLNGKIKEEEWIALANKAVNTLSVLDGVYLGASHQVIPFCVRGKTSLWEIAIKSRLFERSLTG